MKHPRVWIALACALFAGSVRAADETRPFEWKDGDRVVLIGDTLIERDQKYGYLETILTAANPDKTITFRNLGWSGDTVRGLSRARFGPPAEGWQHLIDHVNALKPTVLIVGYGMADSFDGEAGLPAFTSGLNELIDAVSASKPRLIFLSPIAHADMGRPLPDPAKHNKDLERYAKVIENVAKERKGRFVDLFESWSEIYNSIPDEFSKKDLDSVRDVIKLAAENKAESPKLRDLTKIKEQLPRLLTENGIHVTDKGAWLFGVTVAIQLSSDVLKGWNVEFHHNGRLGQTSGTSVTPDPKQPVGVHFEARDANLPVPWMSLEFHGFKINLNPTRKLTAKGLPEGRYRLTIDGQTPNFASGSWERYAELLKTWPSLDESFWAAGIELRSGPEFDQVEKLRQAINRKNELYFYRWRPQNETYLFGFRKHEQGNNAREIPLFDPLVEEQEKLIAKLKKPVPHIYELVPTKGDPEK